MEIIVAKNSGFCVGVLNTIKKTEEYLKKNKCAYIHGDIVHNELVINKLAKEGLITINDVNDIKENSTVIIRAHGEEKAFFDYLNNKKANIIDLTCPKVKRIHDLILEHNDSFIVVIGKKNHPEVLGHISYANNYFIVDNKEDINLLLEKIKELNSSKLYIVSQTTFNDSLFDGLVNEIKNKCQNINIEMDKTICDVTRIRQEEIKELSKRVHKMIIIGSNKSSNTKELYEVAKENNKNVYLISDINDLVDIPFHHDDKVGLGAGASTPKELIEQVYNFIQNKS